MIFLKLLLVQNIIARVNMVVGGLENGQEIGI
jgi:hypothetical protein